MTKKTIVYAINNPAIPNNSYWREILDPWFNFEEYDETKTYNKQEHIIWVCYLEQDKSRIDKFIDSGFKVVHEYLWDHYGRSEVENNSLILKSDHWILVDFALRAKHNNYTVNSNPDKLFLCKIRKMTPSRDMFYNKIQKYKDRALISYVDRGVFLPDDTTPDDILFWWHQNPDWFNQTYFSLVVETSVTDSKFISEKIFTPFAFDHPIIAFGPPCIMNLMESLGFGTFGHVINNYYDSVNNIHTRVQLIESEIERLGKEVSNGVKLFTDTLSQEIKAHNRSLIYNDGLITKIVWTEIVQPVLEYADA